MSGEFDISNRESLRALLLQGESADDVVIDVSRYVTYLDSSALHCLTELKKHLTARSEGTVRLVGVLPRIRRILAMIGLDPLFEINSQCQSS